MRIITSFLREMRGKPPCVHQDTELKAYLNKNCTPVTVLYNVGFLDVTDFGACKINPQLTCEDLNNLFRFLAECP